jgi:hypothetical protein
MKKSFFLIPLIIFSCTKETAVTEQKSMDTAQTVIEEPAVHPEDSEKLRDSIINNAPVTQEVLREGVMREEEGKKIVRIADAEVLPFNIGEQFTESGQEFVLKIENFAKDKISVTLKPENEQQNIRINQIKLPDGKLDGPFGREIKDYEVPEKGEVWIVIGRSNMASGEDKGHFSVSVK